MNSPLDATLPTANATVHASAGTGKTWLLVTRLVRLLLHGVPPGRILAVTFTRKAAAEMLERLTERLRLLATVPDGELDTLLEQMGVNPDTTLRRRSRRLYEEVLLCEFNLRTTTFHSVCQEILQRFPLEAGVPPGFELLETEGSYRAAAWDALYTEATAAPESPLGQALDRLMDACGGLANVQSALDSFLAHRIDWWAFTAGQTEPVAWAGERLRRRLEIDADGDPDNDFFHPTLCEQLQAFQALLLKHPTATHQQQADALGLALDAAIDPVRRLTALQSALLTATGEPRKRSINKTLVAKLGQAGADAFIELHETLCQALLELLDARQRRDNWLASCAWYLTGHRLLQHYQLTKRTLRLLDFSDLEWHAYQLLNRSDHAQWVQYKLDNRIDHMLIDEFQDTNPTQWRLILPLLEELAAGGERDRTVFLVGDEKQSIYRFRRADARLLGAASDWLHENLHSTAHSLARSRRSAPAIIDCVNRVFAHPELREHMPGFETHSTFNETLWGRVEVLPLIQPQSVAEIECEVDAHGLRNPLEQPRVLAQDDRYHREGELIAARIREMIDTAMPIGDGAAAHPVGYGDILILLRNRTHVSDLEHALRDAGIPYLGAARGALLDSIEARDLEALLHTLIAPHNNLALAQVLRSPLFAVSDTELVRLAEENQGDWMARLTALAARPDVPCSLVRAADDLSRWRGLVGRLPVHDLLDRIFFEGDVLARYRSATPAVMQPQVLANLQRFLELALEIDSGRYPSLPRFLLQLAQLRDQANEAPDDAAPEAGGEGRVRFLTVHSAKGLEAPVVFLVDSAGANRDRSAWQAMVDWPAASPRPEYFLLNPGKARRDRLTQGWQDEQTRAEARENANLLYVALTRPRQVLVVSGTAGSRGNDSGWYGLIRTALAPEGDDNADLPIAFETGTPPVVSGVRGDHTAAQIAVDPRLGQALQLDLRSRRLAPSRRHDVLLDAEAFDADGRTRGQAIHMLLEWLSEPNAVAPDTALRRLGEHLGRRGEEDALQQWLEEAQALIADTGLGNLFQADRFEAAYKEVPLQYLQGDILVEGVVDRLIRYPDRVLIVDYKTHRLTDLTAADHAISFTGQMRYYADGVRRLWPHLPVECAILYTHSRKLVILDLD